MRQAPSLLIIFIVFLLVNTVCAAPALDPNDLKIAVPLMAIAMTAFIGVVIMISSAISNAQLHAWAKNELREQAAGIVLVVIVLAVFVASNAASTAITGNSDPVSAARGILDTWLAGYDSAFSTIIRVMTKIRSASSYAPNVAIPLWHFSLNYGSNPLSGAGILMSPMSNATQSLANAVFLIEGLRMLLMFMKVAIPTILLPLAFIARLTPFARRLGDTLIAISIAGLLLFPFSIILTDALNHSLGSGFPNPQIAEGTLSDLDANPWAMVGAQPFCQSVPIRSLLAMQNFGFAETVCLPVGILFPASYPACISTMAGAVFPMIGDIFQIVFGLLVGLWELLTTLAGGSAGPGGYGARAFDIIYPFLRDVGNLVLIGYLDFIMIVTVTIAGARSISTALGGEWYMAGIQRLI